MRRLFNMDKGVANMASYDSGKQTITDTAKAIGSAVKTAVAVGSTVSTAGAAIAAMGALGPTGAAGALGSSGAAGALGEAGEMLGEAGEAIGGAGDGLDQFGELNPNLGNEEDGSLGIGNTWDNAQEYLEFQANNEGYDSVAALRAAYGDEGINEMLGAAGYTQNDLDDFSDGDIKALADGIKEGTEDSNEANLSRMENMDGLSQNKNEERKRIFVEFG